MASNQMVAEVALSSVNIRLERVAYTGVCSMYTCMYVCLCRSIGVYMVLDIQEI